jgi:radical SAM superfamily enzyme YgiQ (UPF0313 family)
MKVRFITPYYGVKGQRLLTLPCLAAEFSPYCDVEVCDQNVEEVDYSDCDMVGISLLVYNAPIGYEIAKRFRERGIPVIMGGSWPSVSPHLVAPYCDSVVVGEVEGLGGQIIRDLEKGRLQKIYRNEVPPSLDTLCLPRLDLLKSERYFQATGYPMETTRGCPNACTFCVSGKIQPTFRKKPYWMVIRDLEARDSPILNLYDLNVGADKAYFKDIARIFAEFPIFAWQCETCIGYLDDDELLDLLEKSNLNQVYVGIESISEKSLASINKSFNQVKRYKEIIKKCHDHGIHIAAGFIVGLDGVDKSIFEKSLEFFNEVRVEYTTPLYLTYLPGTPMHDRLRKEGRILTENLADYDGTHPIVRPNMMTVDELQEGVEWFVKEFYGAKSFALRMLQRPNLNPFDLLGYLSFNWWFGGMYRSIFERDEEGRSPATDRALYEKLTLQPIDKQPFGMGLGDDIMTVVNKADRLLRPLQRAGQSLLLPSDSMTKRYRLQPSVK